ncbi:protein phosphatase 2C domain-containing protein [Glycomyces paridis]|uniref:Protein phosphatase 2C domain-containing protein n=1 Tax=Glycomyces paridis TaxID=2126555 RepID=A0A4S8PF43_9ACTN|nr:protein phosphatase 2C domain-containing protein [Glycomyces paridis]THV29020.1 protein phosphatase 2C domain-containing protein [Glycomyces paridis]
MIEVGADSRAGGTAPNEDGWWFGGTWALVLDGITRYPDDGCVHDVPWYVERLGEAVADDITDPGQGLVEVLGAAIREVGSLHGGTCDLANPVSPGATVGMVREAGDAVEWLALGDCSIAFRGKDGAVSVESDERLARLADPPRAVDVGGVRRYPVEYIERVRNREGGFWVASTDPGAAEQARHGSRRLDGLTDLMLCTDGLARLVERYGYSWSEVFRLADTAGAEGLVDLVRLHGDGDTRFGPGAKRHDDATLVVLAPGRLDGSPRRPRALPARSGRRLGRSAEVRIEGDGTGE